MTLDWTDLDARAVDVARILAVDAEARTARVEPGVVLDTLTALADSGAWTKIGFRVLE